MTRIETLITPENNENYSSDRTDRPVNDHRAPPIDLESMYTRANSIHTLYRSLYARAKKKIGIDTAVQRSHRPKRNRTHRSSCCVSYTHRHISSPISDQNALSSPVQQQQPRGKTAVCVYTSIQLFSPGGVLRTVLPADLRQRRRVRRRWYLARAREQFDYRPEAGREKFRRRAQVERVLQRDATG